MPTGYFRRIYLRLKGTIQVYYEKNIQIFMKIIQGNYHAIVSSFVIYECLYEIFYALA